MSSSNRKKNPQTNHQNRMRTNRYGVAPETWRKQTNVQAPPEHRLSRVNAKNNTCICAGNCVAITTRPLQLAEY